MKKFNVSDYYRWRYKRLKRKGKDAARAKKVSVSEFYDFLTPRQRKAYDKYAMLWWNNFSKTKVFGLDITGMGLSKSNLDFWSNLPGEVPGRNRVNTGPVEPKHVVTFETIVTPSGDTGWIAVCSTCGKGY